jgi:hypothetical protein
VPRLGGSLEIGAKNGLTYREFTDRRLDAGVFEPDHPSFVVRNLGPIVVVRLEVPVHHGMRMVGSAFVDVLAGRDDGGEHEARRECERKSRSPGWREMTKSYRHRGRGRLADVFVVCPIALPAAG